MKTFLRILLGLIILLALIIIIGFFLPSKIHVERSLTIKAPKEVLFNQVSYLRCWEDWSPWHKIDTAMKIVYEGAFSGTGASYSWTSGNKNVGSGKLTIVFSKPYDSIATEMVFMEMGITQGYYLFQDTDSGTLVTWGLNTNLGKNPFTKYFGLMTDKFVGKDFETGLQNLDSISKNLHPWLVEIKNRKDFLYVSIKKRCDWDAISQVMAESYAKLMKYIQSSDAEMTGPPYAIYHKMEDEAIDIEMGIPVNKVLLPKGNISTGKQNQIVTAATDYYGFYDNIGEAHGAVQDWILKMKFETAGSPMEVYVTDPSTESDTAKWQTRIYYPVVLH